MATAPRPGSDRAQLAAKLRELRAATGMSGSQFARHLGWPQSRVSKLETGTQFPTGEDIDAWLAATGAEAERATVGELLVRSRIELVSLGHELAVAPQRSVGVYEKSVTEVATFQPAMIPGLLQTAAFARELLALPSGPAALGATSTDDVEQLVATRVERQNLLYDNEKTLRFVLGEAALWTRIGSLATHRGQLDRLQSVAGLATVDLRIVPFTRPMPVFPLHGFTVYGTELVRIETITDDYRLSAPEEIETYRGFFEALHDAALPGEDAIALIQSVSRGLG